MQLIQTLTPQSMSAARPALEYRIREQRAESDRGMAVEQIGNLGVAAAPAVPLLSRLLDDMFEPERLKVRMVYA